jgi:hypothetical protein
MTINRGRGRFVFEKQGLLSGRVPPQDQEGIGPIKTPAASLKTLTPVFHRLESRFQAARKPLIVDAVFQGSFALRLTCPMDILLSKLAFYQ